MKSEPGIVVLPLISISTPSLCIAAATRGLGHLSVWTHLLMVMILKTIKPINNGQFIKVKYLTVFKLSYGSENISIIKIIVHLAQRIN